MKKNAVTTRKRGSTYSYRFEGKKGRDEKRKLIERGGFSSAKEAYSAGVVAYAEHIKGNAAISSESITVALFLDLWLEQAEASAKPTTMRMYSAHADTIKAFLGKKKLQELTPADIDAFYKALYVLGKSSNTIKAKKAVLVTALKYAVFPAGFLSFNPAVGVGIPKNAPKKVVERKVVEASQLREILDAYPMGNAAHMPILIAYFTGMRVGEILALSWADIDMERRVIHVRRQVSSSAGKGNFLAYPKSESGIRSIYFGDELAKALEEWKAVQECAKIKIYSTKEGKLVEATVDCPEYKREHLVCTKKSGKAVSQRWVNEALRKFGLNAHSLRHTHATILTEANIPPKTIASVMGHKSVELAQNVYAHATDSMLKQSAEAFEETFKRANKWAK